MDQSTQPTQNTQSQTRLQEPTAQIPTSDPGQPVNDDSQFATQSISVNKESGAATIQETKNQVEAPTSAVETKEIEVQPSTPEPAIDASVEHVVEKSVDQEKPILSESVKQAGVTHSGPGVIPDTTIKIDDNKFGIKNLDVPYSEAVATEKHTPFKSSKHWLMGIYEYVWRKINPKITVKQ